VEYSQNIDNAELQKTANMPDPIAVASTIQSASIKKHPDPALDLNPSTAADKKVVLDEEHVHHHLDSDDDDTVSEISSTVLRPQTRRQNMPPLPDLRFEQSYLASIKDAETYYQVAYITLRDQFVLPLVQGTIWTLALTGFRYWNSGARLSGQGFGGK
jgi:hypothetical protein